MSCRHLKSPPIPDGGRVMIFEQHGDAHPQQVTPDHLWLLVPCVPDSLPQVVVLHDCSAVQNSRVLVAQPACNIRTVTAPEDPDPAGSLLLLCPMWQHLAEVYSRVVQSSSLSDRALRCCSSNLPSAGSCGVPSSTCCADPGGWDGYCMAI